MPQYIGYSFEVSLTNFFILFGLTFYKRNFVSKIMLKEEKRPQQLVLLANQPLANPNLLPQVSLELNQRSSRAHPFSVPQRTRTLQTQGLVHLAKIPPNNLLAIRKEFLEIRTYLDRHNSNRNHNRKTLLVPLVHLVNQHNRHSNRRVFLVVAVLSARPANLLSLLSVVVRRLLWKKSLTFFDPRYI